MRARAVGAAHGRAGQDAEKGGVVSSSDTSAQDEAKAKSASVTSRVMAGRGDGQSGRRKYIATAANSYWSLDSA